MTEHDTAILWGSDDPATLRNPYPAYKHLRENAPWYDHSDGYTVVSRYDDVLAVLQNEAIGYEDDPVAGVAARAGEGPFANNIGSWLLSMNNPRHNTLRRVIGSAFLPRNVKRLQDQVVQQVQLQFDKLAAAGGGDALQEIAFEVPSDLICQLMGVNPDDRGLLAKLTNSVAAVLFEAAPTEQMINDGNAAVLQVDDYFRRLIEQRRKDRGEDLISTMITNAEQAGDIDDYELLANVHFMYGAGYEETHCFIASGIYHLLANPGLAERQRTDSDGGVAVQRELLRYDTPLQSTLRLVRQDVEINGHLLRAGQNLQLLLGSANRDDAIFFDADSLVVDRPEEPRIASFGGGIHHCAGHPLARMVSLEVFNQLVRRRFVLAVDAADISWRPGSVYRCLESLPITTG